MGIALFLFFSNGFIFNEFMRIWEIDPVQINELTEQYEAAIVLGGAANVERKPNDRLFLNESADRITQAVHLYKAGIVDKIIYTGGKSRLFEDAEADNDPILLFYTDCGIPKEDIILESESRNTHENASHSAKMLDTSKKYILITSAFHMRRAAACFEKEGVKVIPFSCDFLTALEKDRFSVSMFIPSINTIAGWDGIIKELLGIVAYKLMGYI